MDYMLTSLQLSGRSSSHVLTLETVMDNSDHMPILLELATFLQRKLNNRHRIPPVKPKFLGWRLDSEVSAKKSHATSNYSDHNLNELELGSIAGKFKEGWRLKLEGVYGNSTFLFTGWSNKLGRKSQHFFEGALCVFKTFGRHIFNCTYSLRPFFFS